MKTKYRLLILLFIVISGCGYTPVRTPFVLSGDYYQARSINDDRLCILSWNIHKEVDEENWEKDFITIVRNNTKKPTIILLQEVRLETNMIRILKEELNLGWEFSPNLYQEEYDAYSGVLTAATIKPTMVQSALSSGVEPFTQTPKPVLFTNYSLGRDSFELLVVNIHGINFKFGLNEFKEQLRYIAEFVKGHEGPVIMAGDFNTWSKDRLDHLDRIAKELELVKAPFGSKSDHISTVAGNPLDHNFVSKETLEVVEGSQDVLVDINSSDHKPLFVEVRIRR
jgi:endonuclease/exonuclease/phosphatase (EEP) superfamily protein YafD